jgi:hypothetical protein
MAFGAMAYSEATVWLGYTCQHPDTESAAAAALAFCDRPDATLLCSESDCWMAFVLSDETGAYAWAARPDRDAAIAEASALVAGTAADGRLIVCFSTNTGEEYDPSPPAPEEPSAGQPAPQSGRGWETAKKVAEVAGKFVRAVIKGD